MLGVKSVAKLRLDSNRLLWMGEGRDMAQLVQHNADSPVVAVHVLGVSIAGVAACLGGDCASS